MTIWLAVGDEAGNWDAIGKAEAAANDRRSLGVALVIAPIPAWKAALQAPFAYTTVEQHMQCCPVTGAKQAHHIKDTLDYLKDHHLQGRWQLDDPGPDPVKSSLCQSFHWLARHPHLITLGAHARLDQIRADLHHADDPAQALGKLYGLLAAFIFPFLPPGDELQIAPGLRSEPLVDNLALQRVDAARPGAATPDKRIDGDSRGMVSALKQIALERLHPWPDLQAETRLDAGILKYFSADWQAFLPYNALNAIADLAASLLSATQFPGYPIDIPNHTLPAGNVCFKSLDELLDTRPS